MKQVVDYLKEPSTIRKIIVGIFVLGILWANLNSTDKSHESRISKLEGLDLESRLTKIEVDVSWIRETLENKSK